MAVGAAVRLAPPPRLRHRKASIPEALRARAIPWAAVSRAGTVEGTAASPRETMALSAAATAPSGPKTGTAMPVQAWRWETSWDSSWPVSAR